MEGPRLCSPFIRDTPFPDYAEFIIGPAEGRTRWLHPGYTKPVEAPGFLS
jgi:hypothetical protein